MGSDLNRSFAIYPMVEEGEATGVVAGVYAQILDGMPFVPSVFKSLALCPGYLVLAWAQSSAVLSHDAFSDQVTQLVGSAQHAAQPPDDEDCRAALARFVEPLGKMLLLSAGLLEAVEGRLPGSPASPSPPAPEPLRPSRPAPSQWDADNPELYGRIRAALDTPIVNSIWRALADAGLLAATWEALAPQVERTRAVADRLQSDAIASTRQVEWPVQDPPARPRARCVQRNRPPRKPMNPSTPRHSVSATAAIVDESGRVLVICRRDDPRWEPPGGVLELEETRRLGVPLAALDDGAPAVRAHDGAEVVADDTSQAL